MVQWAIELSQFDIEYRPTIVIKAQALADFIAKFTLLDPNPEAKYWTMCANGLFVAGLGGVGVIVTLLEKDIFSIHRYFVSVP